MAGLDPAIHHSSQDFFEEMDARVKPAHDGNSCDGRKEQVAIEHQ